MHKPHTEIEQVSLRTVAPRRFSAIPRPFLKWAGSKQALLNHFADVLPRNYDTYYEPFLGSGAMFFFLKPKKAVLSDACSDLVRTYLAVRENFSAVKRYLTPLKPNKELYYEIRANRSEGRFKFAAEFIYLNKTCWNGLYRVNSSGQFNVPYGAPRTDHIFDAENLEACAKLLSQKGVSLSVQDFEVTISKAKAGDLVFLDPPYVTGHNNNGFRDWNEVLFSWADQERLAKCAHALSAKGVHVIISNANHRDVVNLYKDFSVKPLDRSSTLASNAAKRRTVSEVIIHNTPRLEEAL